MASPAATGSGLFKFIRPGSRLQSTDVQAAALWGVAAGTAALYLVQPFNWLRKTFFEKPDPEEKWRAMCILLPAILIWLAGATLSSVYGIIIMILCLHAFHRKATLYCLFGLICTSFWFLLSLSLSLSLPCVPTCFLPFAFLALIEYFGILSCWNVVSCYLIWWVVASKKISESDLWSFNCLLKPVPSTVVSVAEFE